uniref:Uncharacterized protein n=1 Tax=Gallus gallus TaxID=9031 RepID=A0A8V0XJE0_CHICK
MPIYTINRYKQIHSYGLFLFVCLFWQIIEKATIKNCMCVYVFPADRKIFKRQPRKNTKKLLRCAGRVSDRQKPSLNST